MALATPCLTFTSAEGISGKTKKCKTNLTYNLKPLSFLCFFFFLWESHQTGPRLRWYSHQEIVPYHTFCCANLLGFRIAFLVFVGIVGLVAIRSFGIVSLLSIDVHLNSGKYSVSRRSSYEYWGDLECVSQILVCCNFFDLSYCSFQLFPSFEHFLPQLFAKFSCRATKECPKFTYSFRSIWVSNSMNFSTNGLVGYFLSSWKDKTISTFMN